MRKKSIWITAVTKACLAACFLVPSLVSATLEDHSSHFLTNSYQSQTPNNQTNTPSFSSSQLGWNGPLSFGISHDNLYNYSWNVQYTQKFNDNFALSGLYEYASDMYRFGGTIGFIFLNNNLFKFSAERLSEVLPFNFDSGNINERIAQNAFGAKYEYAINNKIWKNLDIGGFYSKAQSKALEPKCMTFNGMHAMNYRNIAGGIGKGFDVGAEFDLTKYTALNGHLYYDKVDFDTINTSSSSDSSGLGWSVGVNQLIGSHFMIGGEASNRKLYNTYTANVSWLPPRLAKMGFEIALLAEHLVSNNQMPNINSIGLKLNFNPDTIMADNVYYQLPSKHATDDISIWTSKPAVHMDQVLAIADQKTVVLDPIITAIDPTSGPAAGGTIVTISGDNFVGTTGVTFGSMPAISFSIDSPTTIRAQAPSHAAGTVDLIVTNPGGSATTQFTYTAADSPATPPIINSITPSSGQLGHEITATINGKNFIKGATVKIGSILANINSIASNKIVAVIPAFNGSRGKVDITVTNPDGTSAQLPGGFSYLGTQETKPNNHTNDCTAYLTPTAGPNPAGNVVTIYNGSGFTTATTIDVFFPPNLHKSIPGSPGSSINHISPDGTSITFTLPSGGTGPAYISTVNPLTCNQPFIFYYHSSSTFVIQSSTGANGTISPLGTTTVNAGGSVTYNMTPNVGYAVQDVLVDGVSVGAVSSYTFSNVQADHTISVTFAITSHTITASAGSGGSISPSGAITVNYGSNQSFTITPDSCHTIADVLVDDVSQGTISSYTFSNVTTNHTISATFTAKTNDITASAGTGGSISPDGTVSVNCGEDQTFNISSDAGYKISNVLVDGSPVGAVTSYTFTNVTTSHTISATFELDGSIGVTSSTGPHGTIGPYIGFHAYQGGTSPTYTMTPDSNYHVKDVLVDGVSQGAITTYTFSSINTTHSISVTFEIDTNTIDASAGANGSISPSGSVSVDYGSDQTFYMTPDVGYNIADVLVDGSSVGTPSSYTFSNVTTNHTIAVTFAIKTHTITASAGSNGDISNPGTNTVNYGDNLGFTMTPAIGYHVADVTVDGVSQGPITSYDFTNVVTDHTINVTFVGDTVTIEASSSFGGSISPAGTISLPYNDQSPTFTMTSEDADDVLLDVVVDGVSIGPVSTYSFGSNVTANHTIFAKFAFHSASVTAIPSCHGQITPPGTVVYREDSEPTYTITADSGYTISSILIDGQPISLCQGLTCYSYTFEELEEAHTISATFVPTHKVETAKPISTFMADFYHTYLQKRHQKQFELLEISPNYGSRHGGDTVTINFNKFKQPPTKVKFGGIEAKILTIEKNSITVKTPPHHSGKVDIEISNSEEAAILKRKFTYRHR